MAIARGELSKGTLTVAAVTADYYALDSGGGVVVRRDRDLGNLGAWTTAGEAQHPLDPVDVRYHWPLWIGKRWSCEFIDRLPNATPVTMRADYVVEDLDSVTVAAGTFSALRIVRTLRLIASQGEYLTRTQLTWYAPSIGWEVRQVIGDVLFELVEHTPAR